MTQRSLSTTDAVRAALLESLAADAAILVLGETAGRPGDPLAGADPERVLALPVADRGSLGFALGAALAGRRVVVELSGPGRLPAVAEVLVEAGAIAAKGEFPCVLVVRVPCGREAGELDQPVGRWLADLPGVQVVVGSTPDAAASLLRGALAGRGPVVVLEPRSLRQERGPVTGATRGPRSTVHREGRDATVVAFGAGVAAALAAADTLAGEGLEASVLELEALAPLDRAALGDAVRRNGRLVVAHDGDATLARAVRDAVADEAFWWLEAPLADGGPAAPVLADLVRRAIQS